MGVAVKGTKNLLGDLLGTCTSLPGFGLAGGATSERHLQSGEAAGPGGTAFNYHEPQTR